LDGVVYVPLCDKDAFSTLHLGFRERDRNTHLQGLLFKLRERVAATRWWWPAMPLNAFD
jgi:hypothetical protein